MIVAGSSAAAATEGERARMLDAFKRSSQYEWMFWDAAWKHGRWTFDRDRARASGTLVFKSRGGRGRGRS